MSGRPSKDNIAALTGLRFLAALYVALYHFCLLIPYPPEAWTLLSHGSAAVLLFFVLSGFVLTYNYADAFADGLAGYGRFVQARLARIGPMHVITLLLVTPLGIWALGRVGGSLSPAMWLVNLSFLQAWLPNGYPNPLNEPSWSVSTELSFYLLFPLLARYVFRWPMRTLLPLAALLTVAPDIVVALLPADLVAALIGPFCPLWFPGVFCAGCVLSLSWMKAAQPGSAGPLAILRTSRFARETLAAFATACFVTVVVAAPGTTDAAMVPLDAFLASCLIAALASGPTFLGRVLERPTMRLLGEASYSLYLLHGPVILGVSLTLGRGSPYSFVGLWTTVPSLAGAGPSPLLAIAILAATILVSIAAYIFVEAPARRLLRPHAPALTSGHAN